MCCNALFTTSTALSLLNIPHSDSLYIALESFSWRLAMKKSLSKLAKLTSVVAAAALTALGFSANMPPERPIADAHTTKESFESNKFSKPMPTLKLNTGGDGQNGSEYYSHRSHRSHSSHRSHRSHYSHRSGGL